MLFFDYFGLMFMLVQKGVINGVFFVKGNCLGLYLFNCVLKVISLLLLI